MLDMTLDQSDRPHAADFKAMDLLLPSSAPSTRSTFLFDRDSSKLSVSCIAILLVQTHAYELWINSIDQQGILRFRTC